MQPVLCRKSCICLVAISNQTRLNKQGSLSLQAHQDSNITASLHIAPWGSLILASRLGFSHNGILDFWGRGSGLSSVAISLVDPVGRRFSRSVKHSMRLPSAAGRVMKNINHAMLVPSYSCSLEDEEVACSLPIGSFCSALLPFQGLPRLQMTFLQVTKCFSWHFTKHLGKGWQCLFFSECCIHVCLQLMHLPWLQGCSPGPWRECYGCGNSRLR